MHFWPFVYGIKGVRHPETLRKFYIEDRSQRYAVRLFVRGAPYRFWGLFETDVHLFGVDDGGTLFLLGTDHLGRDLLSRIIYGSRISLTIGLVGVTLSFVFGLVIGVVSGYYGGWIDNLIQRGIEILRSFPSIPLWMALAAALPSSWSPLQIYMGITVVLSFYWMDGSGSAGARKNFVVARRGFCNCCAACRRESLADYDAAFAAFVYEPYYREFDARCAGHDFGRDVAEFSRSWVASASD